MCRHAWRGPRRHPGNAPTPPALPSPTSSSSERDDEDVDELLYSVFPAEAREPQAQLFAGLFDAELLLQYPLCRLLRELWRVRALCGIARGAVAQNFPVATRNPAVRKLRSEAVGFSQKDTSRGWVGKPDMHCTV
eukprot:CAMPEP_0206494244 /NCGR_PEP_ID=MMETSP0324_2-20121206/47590_1 /ASSEMBLY_ACC=CAM_ASM_000836 /TAXON_ID=2866 /ORGANISM="Crypthecodinium cohnii, Strain Seligo" /LENGTH=134 /DNA_ID=CAMNT_0053977817 /DNA_START=34 /DNA_END=438 /DNA_ORIENTATION=-